MVTELVLDHVSVRFALPGATVAAVNDVSLRLRFRTTLRPGGARLQRTPGPRR